jgi:hypothetical protein
MWSALETSAFSSWVAVSRWAYPTLLSLHGLGMAVVVGLTSMIALRVLGFPRQVPLGAYRKTLPWVVCAFLVNAASGIALFVIAASGLAANVSFQVKLISIALGLVVLWRLYAGPVAQAAVLETQIAQEADCGFVASRVQKAVAVAALLIWVVAVVVSGRLIAYLSVVY